MRKIERRAAVCLLLSAALVLGTCIFSFLFFKDGGRWVSFAANRHLYNSSGELSVGQVLDRDGDLLSWVDASGRRVYYANTIVRKATLHTVGDTQGKIGSGALVAFADKLSGYNLITGAYTPLGEGNDLYLTIDAHLNYVAYQALNGRKGAVAVTYEWHTCMDMLVKRSVMMKSVSDILKRMLLLLPREKQFFLSFNCYINHLLNEVT